MLVMLRRFVHGKEEKMSSLDRDKEEKMGSLDDNWLASEIQSIDKAVEGWSEGIIHRA
jgi:hypothetical protein